MAEEDKTVKEDKTGQEKQELKATSDKKEENKAMPEWLAPILSALGSMGGSYMLFIKPLQERMDAITTQVNDLKAEIKELKQRNKELEKELKEMEQGNSTSISGYLPVKQADKQALYVKKRF